MRTAGLGSPGVCGAPGDAGAEHLTTEEEGLRPTANEEGAAQCRLRARRRSLRPSRPRSPARPTRRRGFFVPAPRPPLRALGPAPSVPAIGQPGR